MPHCATEDELKNIFGKFGTVIDLRIHSKTAPRLSGQRAPQNYGFITYEDPESVQNCLQSMVCPFILICSQHEVIDFWLNIIFFYYKFIDQQPLYYPDGTPEGQKLNVEEKKARMRNDNMNNIDRMDRDRAGGDRVGLGRSSLGGSRNNGDRDRGINMNHNSGENGKTIKRKIVNTVLLLCGGNEINRKYFPCLHRKLQ